MSARGYFVRSIFFGGMVVLFTLPALLSYAQGLRVGPSDVTLKNIPVGALYDFEKENGILLKIYNDSDEIEAYAISSLKSSEINNVPEGYKDIPEQNWLYFETDSVEIEPRGVKEVKMYLEIPYDKRHYGQFWVVSVRVKTIPRAGQGISLACHPRIRIETVKFEE